MGFLAIRQIKYVGDNYYYTSPILKNGMNVLKAPTRSGKSTFMRLIYYGLGGRVSIFNKNSNGKKSQSKHTEITEDTNNRVELLIEIDKRSYSLIRSFEKKQVLVLDLKAKTSYVYPIYRSADTSKIFSDWLLEKLDIEVVEIYKGGEGYKINARDIFRLIYHNQELDPSGVYKSSDASSAYDSQNIRATIFQLLIGRAFSEYYTTETELKEQVKEKDTLKLIIKEFNRTFEMLNDGREVMNSKFIEKKIEEESHKLSALEKQRDNLKKNRISSSDGAFIDVNKLKEEISRVSEQIENKDKERRKKVTERRRFEAHRETHRMELKNIEKIIVSHETLSIFDINTCPSCLRPTPRKENHCICGQPIDEYEYERFFYTTAEYTDILQSKQSAGKTIDIAIEATKKEISVLSNQISSLDKIYKLRKKEVKERLSKIEAGIDTKSLDKLEDEMLKAKEEVKTLRRLLIEEKRREGYQEKYERAEKAVNTLQSNLNKLRESTHKEMEVKIEKFDKIYNELMRATLSECRSARIDPYDYMPIINNGEYREASSYVPRRLMYYITLLSMSLQDKTIKFPQLLLVDTPQTAGVGKDDLAHALSIIPQEVEGKEEYQIILTTAGDVLPTTLEKFVFQTLKGNKDKLLIKRK